MNEVNGIVATLAQHDIDVIEIIGSKEYGHKLKADIEDCIPNNVTININ